jgi:hypothetical protein
MGILTNFLSFGAWINLFVNLSSGKGLKKIEMLNVTVSSLAM